MRTPLMSKTIRSAVIAGASLLLVAAPAFATTVPGYSGKSTVTPGTIGVTKNAAVTCLNEVNGGVLNNCGQAWNYEIPLPVNSAGLHQVDVSVLYNGTGTLACTLYTAGQFGSLTPGTTFTVPSQDAYVYFPLSVTVQSGSDWIGSMFLYCQLPANSTIWNVNYTP
jgi:hypothetical protein